jgi:hypothetical protein
VRALAGLGREREHPGREKAERYDDGSHQRECKADYQACESGAFMCKDRATNRY